MCCLKYKLACICCLAQNRSYFCRQSWDPPKPGQEYLTLLLPLWLVTESMQAIVICFVHVCSVIGTVGIIHYIKKVSFTCIQVWGWVFSGALKYWSAAELGFRTPIYNTKRAAVERAQSRINTFERAAQCHADSPTRPEEDHIFKRPYLSIDLEYLEYCIHILSCAV